MVEKRSRVKSQKSEAGNRKIIELPLTKKDVLSLRVGDRVLLSGQLVTGRDRIHKFLFHERPQVKEIPFDLKGAVLYHCGPVIRRTEGGFTLIAGGPTTSIRVEMYEPQIIADYGIRGIMGKGGMGRKTLQALKDHGCVYLHTISGAAVYLADRIKRVVDVWKFEDFGMAEAMWMFEVEDFPAIVTMDAHGRSLHEEIEKKSYGELKRLIGFAEEK
jgi:tartrate/fumarate subfamily iron-sulfur-dependent hydro-lyase beta chain